MKRFVLFVFAVLVVLVFMRWVNSDDGQLPKRDSAPRKIASSSAELNPIQPSAQDPLLFPTNEQAQLSYGKNPNGELAIKNRTELNGNKRPVKTGMSVAKPTTKLDQASLVKEIVTGSDNIQASCDVAVIYNESHQPSPVTVWLLDSQFQPLNLVEFRYNESALDEKGRAVVPSGVFGGGASWVMLRTDSEAQLTALTKTEGVLVAHSAAANWATLQAITGRLLFAKTGEAVGQCLVAASVTRPYGLAAKAGGLQCCTSLTDGTFSILVAAIPSTSIWIKIRQDDWVKVAELPDKAIDKAYSFGDILVKN